MKTDSWANSPIHQMIQDFESPTPETDAAEHDIDEIPAGPFVSCNFARKLERERNAAIAERDELRRWTTGSCVAHLAKERDTANGERDELAERLDFQEKLNRECIDQIGARTDERDEVTLRWEQTIDSLFAERALADRLALALNMTRWDSPVTCKKAFDAWMEARHE